MVNPKPSLVALGAIKNLNTFLLSRASDLIARSVVFGTIVNLKSFLALGLTEKLVYKSIVNPKKFLVALSIIKNLNTLLFFYILGLITHNTVLSAIVNLKSFSIKDVRIGI